MSAKSELTKKLRDVRPLEALILLPDNPRHGDIGAITESLKRFGQQKPIVINRDGVILAGNHTYQAAKVLGWEEIWVTESELEGMDQPGFALADNRLSDLATYDHDVLLRMLEEQPDLAGTGYDLDDLQAVKDEIKYQDSEPDDRDERYTPRWLFEAMDMRFDVDLAAPPGGVSYIPADRWFTKDDDALRQDWTGLFAWCNPPFSMAADFGRKWLAETEEGVWLGPLSHSTQYRIDLMRKAVNIWFPNEMEFMYRDNLVGVAFPVFLAGFGERGTVALERLNGTGQGILMAVV